MTNQPDDRCEHLVTEQAGSSYLRCKDCGVLKELTLNSSISAGLSMKTASEEIATVDPDDLLERLTRTIPMVTHRGAVVNGHVNPDGPEAAATIKELKAEVERWWRAYGIAHDQATDNGSRLLVEEARAARAEEALVDLAELSGEFGISLPMRVRNALAAIPKITGKALGEEKA